MVAIRSIFEDLQATNSKLEKERILKIHGNNQALKTALNFTLNPFVTTGLSTKKMNKKVDTKPTVSFGDMLEAMTYIENNNTGTDEVIVNLQNFFEQQPDDMIDFYKGIFTKSIKLGCAANTVNKVYGKGFIPQFECMLAEKYFDYAEKVMGKNFSILLKLDGIRCLAVKRNNLVKLFSRQGQLVEGLIDIEQALIKISHNDFVLDGELLITEVAGMASKDQYKATTKIVRKDGEKHGVTFRVFDYLEIDEFMNQEGILKYTEKRSILESRFADMRYIEVLPVLYTGNDMAQVATWLEKVRSDAQEGLMLNINDATYEFKLTQNLLKVKVMENCDLKIIGFEEGQGRLTGTLGRLNVEYKGNTVGVGSGFSDADRAYIWKNQNQLLGRVVSVNYFEETESEGIPSLRFPVFVEIRELGKIPNF